MIRLKNILSEGIFTKNKGPKIIIPKVLRKKVDNNKRVGGLPGTVKSIEYHDPNYKYQTDRMTVDSRIWAIGYPDNDLWYVYHPGSADAKREMLTKVSKKAFDVYLNQFNIK
jgi:hypothetical protein